MPRILIVDDETAIQHTLSVFLQRAGYDVDTAGDVETALATLASNQFDLVITDIILPKTSGLELVRAIKKSAPEVSVMIMTGEPTAETHDTAVQLGCIDYLGKPFTREVLLEKVASALTPDTP